MIGYTNNQAQTLQPGEAANFTEVFYGGMPCTPSSPKISKQGLYTVSFHGNLGAEAPGTAELTLLVGGVAQPTTSMKVTTAAAGDLQSVGTELPLSVGCCRIGAGLNNITVVNTGDTACTLDANPTLLIEGE